MRKLDGKVAIVTGASSGIGAAAARLFAREGAQLVLTARRAPLLELLADEIGRERAVVVAGDIAEERLAVMLVEAARDCFGRLDIAFNNAGTLGELAPAESISLAGWNETLAVNLTGAFLCAKHQAAAMAPAGGGAILFTSTFVGPIAGLPNMAAYAASKAGVLGLMRVLAVEFGERKVRVNAILPGGVDTPLGAVVANSPEAQALVAGLHALKRIAQPDEIARMALHLLSDDASFVTGAAFCVDGGVSVAKA